jgi:toxin CcdB
VSQFDVHRLNSGAGLVIDCQSGLLQHLNTRLVVPLMRSDRAPTPANRLNPAFVIEGCEHVVVTQFAAAISVRELGEVITSMAHRSFDILGALDVLISGV